MKRISLLMTCVVAIAVMGTAFTSKMFTIVHYKFKQTFEQGTSNTAPLLVESNWEATQPSCDDGQLLCGLEVNVTSGSPSLATIIAKFEDVYDNNNTFPSPISVNDGTGVYTITIKDKE